MTTRIAATLLLLSFIPSVGCATRDARPGNFAVRDAPSENRDATLDAAEAALVGLGYTIARRDSLDGIIATEPMPIERDGERSVRADNPLRKIAEIRVTGTPSAPKVHCKVVVQEQTAETYRLLAFERGGDDLPGHQTAIDRDAGTTASQNTVWRTVRRDLVSERAILDRMTQPKPAAGQP
jgi:hypothetical protein